MDERLETELATVLDEDERGEEENDEAAEEEEKEAVERDVEADELVALALAAAVGITNAGAFEGTTIVESRDSGAFGPCVLPWPLAWFVVVDEAFTEAPAAVSLPLLLPLFWPLLLPP